jgi:ketosteroid isomerase-like protein
VSQRKNLVESYFEGFRLGDHARILALLTEDVVWDLPGYARLSGKEAFDKEIENEAFIGQPILIVDRLIEEGDTIVALGNGEGTLKGGEPFRFAFCTVLTFAGDLIGRVESYIVPLSRPPAGSAG